MNRLENVLNQAALRIELSDGEDGFIVAECPDIPGCVSQGKTREEALGNIVDAISVCLDVIAEDALKKIHDKVAPDVNHYRLSLSTAELLPS